MGVREKTAIPFWFSAGCVVSTFAEQISVRLILCGFPRRLLLQKCEQVDELATR
jgi:hypothetical protein